MECCGPGYASPQDAIAAPREKHVQQADEQRAVFVQCVHRNSHQELGIPN